MNIRLFETEGNKENCLNWLEFHLYFSKLFYINFWKLYEMNMELKL